MTIKVRQRKPKDGQIRLFLDIYNPNAKNKRTNRILDLFLYENPSTPTQKKTNKENLEAAERIRAKMTLDLAMDNSGLGDLKKKDKSSIDFVVYFKQLTEARYDSLNNYGNWLSAYRHLNNFCPKGIPIVDVDAKWLNEFKYYLQHVAKKKSNQPLSQNSLHSYFNKIKACLNQAHMDDIIPKNPIRQVKGFKEGEVQREFLTFEELQKVAQAEAKKLSVEKAKEQELILANALRIKDSVNKAIVSLALSKKQENLIKAKLDRTRLDSISKAKSKADAERIAQVNASRQRVKDSLATVALKELNKKSRVINMPIIEVEEELSKEEILKSLEVLAKLKLEQERIVEYLTKRINKKPILIYVSSDSVSIEIYDNGIHDKDSVSIIYNKRIIVDKQELKVNSLSSLN